MRQCEIMESNCVSREMHPEHEDKTIRFKDVETDVLLSLYKDVQRSHSSILNALDTASAIQRFYFSADARNCQSTLAEIRSVLFSRGIRQIPTDDNEE